MSPEEVARAELGVTGDKIAAWRDYFDVPSSPT